MEEKERDQSFDGNFTNWMFHSEMMKVIMKNCQFVSVTDQTNICNCVNVSMYFKGVSSKPVIFFCDTKIDKKILGPPNIMA